MAKVSSQPSPDIATSDNVSTNCSRRFPTLAINTSPLPSLPFDLVESILNLLPASDLLSASAVSTSWRLAAVSSPRPRPPSLLLHTHTLGHRSTTTTSVLDPLSPTSSWFHLPPLPSPPLTLRSSTSDSLLYALTSTHLSFSIDPLHLHWTHLASPSIWRVDPVVALVGGNRLLVAAGVSEYDDCEDPLAVEVFSGGRWATAPSMPEAFACSASSVYLSAAAVGGRLCVVDRGNGLFSCFDVEDMTWSEPMDVLAGVESKPFAVAVAAAGEKLVVAGVMGRPEEVEGVRVWEVDGDMRVVEVGEMPEEMVVRFARGGDGDSAAGVTSVEVRAAADGEFLYVYNPSEMGEVFHCKLGGRGGDEKGLWGRVATVVGRGWSPRKRVVVTCTAVGLEEIREALRRGSRRSIGSEKVCFVKN